MVLTLTQHQAIPPIRLRPTTGIIRFEAMSSTLALLLLLLSSTTTITRHRILPLDRTPLQINSAPHPNRLIPHQNLAGMIPQERHTNNDHEHAIQYQQVHLLFQQHVVPAQRVLDHAEQRADHDERRSDVQRPEELAPGHGDRV